MRCSCSQALSVLVVSRVAFFRRVPLSTVPYLGTGWAMGRGQRPPHRGRAARAKPTWLSVPVVCVWGGVGCVFMVVWVLPRCALPFNVYI